MHRVLCTVGAALVQLAHAHQHHRHGRIHVKRDDVTVTDYEIDYVTVVDWVTETALPNSSPSWTWTDMPSATEASNASSSVDSSTPTTYEAVPTTSASPTQPSTTLVTSISTYPSSSPTSTSTSTPVASSSSSAPPSSSGISTSNLSPNGRKAGLSGFPGIQQISAFSTFAPYISWYSDYTPNTPNAQGVTGIPMLWGGSGSACGSTETTRLATFESLPSTPQIMFGFYEPDCDCPDSSEMTVSDAASDWTSLLAPLRAQGTVLGSPSVCKQLDETFLTPFNSAIQGGWDVTNVHINKPNVTEVQKVVEYFANTYGKPVWVSEFACVNDEPSWNPCTDQDQINTFIAETVQYFESTASVVAYGPSNGDGLGDVWPLTDSSGALTTSGNAYLAAIKAV